MLMSYLAIYYHPDFVSIIQHEVFRNWMKSTTVPAVLTSEGTGIRPSPEVTPLPWLLQQLEWKHPEKCTSPWVDGYFLPIITQPYLANTVPQFPGEWILRSSHLKIATVVVKYIESQYLSRSVLVQIDSEFCLNPATRELSGLDVPYDTEILRT